MHSNSSVIQLLLYDVIPTLANNHGCPYFMLDSHLLRRSSNQEPYKCRGKYTYTTTPPPTHCIFFPFKIGSNLQNLLIVVKIWPKIRQLVNELVNFLGRLVYVGSTLSGLPRILKLPVIFEKSARPKLSKIV